MPWREKRKVPSERAMKTESETGVKSDTPFCSWLLIEKTNSGVGGVTLISIKSAPKIYYTRGPLDSFASQTIFVTWLFSAKGH